MDKLQADEKRKKRACGNNLHFRGSKALIFVQNFNTTRDENIFIDHSHALLLRHIIAKLQNNNFKENDQGCRIPDLGHKESENPTGPSLA